jgi:two-component system response regulator YesN
MFGKFRNYREIKQNMSFFAIDLPKDYSIRLMLLTIKKETNEELNIDTHYLSLISIKDTVCSIEYEFEHVYVMQISLTQIALIIIMDARKAVQKDEIDVMIQIYNTLEDEIDLPIRAAISKPSKYLLEMPELFDQCVRTLNTAIYGEFERVLLFEELDNNSDDNFVEKVDLQLLYNELKDLFDATAEDFEQRVSDFIDKHLHEGNPYSKVHIVGFIYSLVNFVTIINLEKAGGNDTIKLDIGIWKQIKELNNLEETKQWVTDHLVSYYKKYHERNTSAYSKISKDIKTIIHNQYKLDLTLQRISDTLGYSANHLNNIFKQLNNKTIFDYLTAYRIEKAKELLKDPYIKIYEVADQVGYGNKSHFSYQFKKIAGMTPLQYKISHE